jgi:hypothetical protein
MNHLLEDLHRLTAVPAPSGRERAIAALVRESWRRFGDVKEDRLGNLSVTPCSRHDAAINASFGKERGTPLADRCRRRIRVAIMSPARFHAR